MNNSGSLAYYELGLRTTQARALFPDFSAVEPSQNAQERGLSRLVQAVSDRRLPIGSTFRNDLKRQLKACRADRDPVHLISIQTSLTNHLSNASSLYRESFELGKLLPNVTDEVFSDGDLGWEPGEKGDLGPGQEQLRYPRLRTGRMVEPAEEWRVMTPEVNRLTERLGVTLETVCPPWGNLSNEDWEVMPELSGYIYWDWKCLERGLAVLRHRVNTRPVWSGRLLTIGEVEVYQYTRVAPQQFAILDRFQSEGWPRQIESPIDDQRNTRDTIDSLNKRTRPNMNFAVNWPHVTCNYASS